MLLNKNLLSVSSWLELANHGKAYADPAGVGGFQEPFLTGGPNPTRNGLPNR